MIFEILNLTQRDKTQLSLVTTVLTHRNRTDI